MKEKSNEGFDYKKQTVFLKTKSNAMALCLVLIDMKYAATILLLLFLFSSCHKNCYQNGSLCNEPDLGIGECITDFLTGGCPTHL